MIASQFPTHLHKKAAEIVNEYFRNLSFVDTVLVVNSCARGQGVPESDLDFAILVKPDTLIDKINEEENRWLEFSQNNPTIIQYKKSSPYAHLHLDLINGIYTPVIWELGVVSDFFELEIGNQICYSMPINSSGSYYNHLKELWLPYYNETLRLERLEMIKRTCMYNLEHIPIYTKRELYFHAFDTLYKAFQEFLQVLFIANKTYPIAYNKWIKYQFISILKKPNLYSELPSILSVVDMESEEVNYKAERLHKILKDII